MIRSEFTYTIALCRENGSILIQIPVEIDWEPAAEWGRLSGVRCGRLSPEGLGLSTWVEPIWHPEAGEPYLKSFRVEVTQEGGQMKVDLPLTYCKEQVRKMALHLIKEKILAEDEKYLYFILGHRAISSSEENPTPSFAIESIVPSIPLRGSAMKTFTQNTKVSGPELDSDDIPVFVPNPVLNKILQLTKQAGALETGGVLIGYIHQDQSIPEVFLEITDQITAEHTESSATKLAFTAHTWSAIQACLKLRNKDEIVLGWWHCHNFMKDVCKDCKKASDKSCSVNALFMSADDCAVHRLCFPKAYSLALVVADGPCTGLTWALFGWKHGSICHRGFHIVSPTDIEQSHMPAKAWQ